MLKMLLDYRFGSGEQQDGWMRVKAGFKGLLSAVQKLMKAGRSVKLALCTKCENYFNV
jgi:hypothetical protein